MNRLRPSRRAVLRGAGLALALPPLESLSARAACAPPRRLLVYMVPNGMNMPRWVCTGPAGTDYKPSSTLQTIAPIRADVLVINGLHNEPAIPKPSGGAHGAGVGGMLTCTRYDKTGAQGLNMGISFDQVAAQGLGACTRLPSVQLTMERRTGYSEFGVPGTMHQTLSWLPKQPLPAIIDPRQAFDRLFAGAPAQAASPADADRRRALRKSVLDRVLEDGKALVARLNPSDRARLDQYTTSLRALEVQIEKLPATAPAACPTSPPASVMAAMDYPTRLAAMHELMALAFQCDVTRVISFMTAEGLSNMPMPWLGINDPHGITHNGEDRDDVQKVDVWRLGQWVAFIQRLKQLTDVDGSPMLRNTVVYYTSEVASGYRHSNENRPTLLAGQLGGTITTGRLMYAGTPVKNAADPTAPTYGADGTWSTCNENSQACAMQTPVANLYVGLLSNLGVPTDKFANSTGALTLT